MSRTTVNGYNLPTIYAVDNPVTQAVLFCGLGPEVDVSVVSDPALWVRALPHLAEQRLASAASHLVKAAGIELSTEIAEQLQTLRRAEAFRTMSADLAGAQALRSFRSAGLDPVVIKGPAAARLDPVAGVRSYVDLDVLFREADFDRSVAATKEAGFALDEDVMARPYFTRWCYEGRNLSDGEGRSIDLHHHIPPWWIGAPVGPAVLGRKTTTITIAGVEARAADAASNLLIAALHIVSDRNQPGKKLLSWRDVAIMAGLVDHQDLVDLTSRTSTGWWLLWIIDQLPIEVRPLELAAALRRSTTKGPNHLDVARIRALVAAGRSGKNLAYVARLPLPNAAAYVNGQLFPSRASISSRLGRDATLYGWWKHVLGQYLGKASSQE